MSVLFHHGDVEMKVGGQAVLEGVMMRSPNSFAVTVRKPDQTVVIKEQPWQSIWKRMKFLRWPFFRGTVVLVESLWNGISALTFSANYAAEDPEAEKTADGENKDQALSPLALIGTILVSLGFALGLFVVIPHMLTLWFGALTGRELTVNSLAFHAVDGVIKVLFFLGYVWAISFLKEIRRVFQYHGAEHMTIFAWEDGKELTVENVRPYTTFHERCGTSFIMVVLITSIILFAIVFPFMPELAGLPKILRNLVYIAIKIPLMLPIAGISYEVIKLAGAKRDSKLLHLAVLPGLWLQRITTRRPTDDQIEIAILSMKKCLWREENLGDGEGEALTEYDNFEEAMLDIDKPPTAPVEAQGEA
jgi:uncharacterized protein YqhQ